MNYPSFWPKPNADKPDSLQTRITEKQKEDLYNRRITTRKLAEDLDVHETYLSYMFYSKAEVTDKKPLIEARKLFKLEIACQVLRGAYNIQQAADTAFVSYNTMHRAVERAKLQSPTLAAAYLQVVDNQRQLSIKKARIARSEKLARQ